MAKTASPKPKRQKTGTAKKSTAAAKPKATRTAAAGKRAEVQQTESSVFRPLFALRRQIDELVEDAFGRLQNINIPHLEWPVTLKGKSEAEVARFDFSENAKAVKVTAEIPGMSKEDIEVVVQDGVLTIKGEKKSEREEKEDNYYLSERQFGAFARAFRLPEGILEDEINADFNNGVLTVTMPKAAASKKAPKRISVKSP